MAKVKIKIDWFPIDWPSHDPVYTKKFTVIVPIRDIIDFANFDITEDNWIAAVYRAIEGVDLFSIKRGQDKPLTYERTLVIQKYLLSWLKALVTAWDKRKVSLISEDEPLITGGDILEPEARVEAEFYSIRNYVNEVYPDGYYSGLYVTTDHLIHKTVEYLKLLFEKGLEDRIKICECGCGLFFMDFTRNGNQKYYNKRHQSRVTTGKWRKRKK